LAYPSFDKDFFLETDASIEGIGAVLSQLQEDGYSQPVSFASRALSPCERNYGITDLETLAVELAITHFRCYLYGHAVTVYIPTTLQVAGDTVLQGDMHDGGLGFTVVGYAVS
jgi:hypothetical protein